MFSTITELVEAITAEENENDRIQIYVDDDALFRYSVNWTCAEADERPLYNIAECPTVAQFFDPRAAEIVAAEIEALNN